VLCPSVRGTYCQRQAGSVEAIDSGLVPSHPAGKLAARKTVGAIASQFSSLFFWKELTTRHPFVNKDDIGWLFFKLFATLEPGRGTKRSQARWLVR
jgi:hypothetical protein